MRPLPAGLLILGAGLVTFGLVFTILETRGSDAAPDLVPDSVGHAGATPMPVLVGPAKDSLAPSLPAGERAVGVPSAGSEALLLDAQRGERLDVLASLPSPVDGRPVTVVVVSGATVLRPATSTDPLLLQVSAPDAIVLAHLVSGGTRLVYTIWPDGGNPPKQPPLDERTARALLGLPPVAVATQPTAEPAPNPVAATPTVLPSVAPRIQTYAVEAGESLYTVATRLGVNPGALWWANRAVVDPTVPLGAGTILQVPLLDGFLYQIQPGDTWESVASIFGLPASDLWQRNALPEDAALVSGMLVFIPSQS